MPWIVRTDYEPPHECRLPNLGPIEDSALADHHYHYTYPAGPGSIWGCDDCHKVYRVMLYQRELGWAGPLLGNPAGPYTEDNR